MKATALLLNLTLSLVVGLGPSRSLASTSNPNPSALAETILADSELDEVLKMGKRLLRTGLNAGGGYGEVWIRDLNTFIELALQENDPPILREALLTFFKFQGETGDIVDGYIPSAKANVGYKYRRSKLAPDLLAHKNTVETDQESSLIQAVHTYVRVTGDRSILEELISGKSVILRLEMALDYLLAGRFDKTHGLLWGATTADWGDVQPEHEWGVELDENSHLTLDIYDNAMFVMAIDRYLDLSSDPARHQRWKEVRDNITVNIRKHLWDSSRQKFIPHIYLNGSPFPAEFDEDTVYYHGGTAVAIQAGLLTPSEIETCLAAMRNNVQQANAGSIGLTVYPPYPDGTFKNPGMKAWSYQNGGDWCWFGGRMIQGLIQHGFVADAYQELKPMVSRVRAHNGFFEWWSRENQPRGSNTFRGSAGVLGKAIQMLLTWAEQHQDSDTTALKTVWRIGGSDADNAEFALAPKGYPQYRADGFFVVGPSRPDRDWPYVQPGPADDWAGRRSHTFTIAFALDRAPDQGEAQLLLELLDTHRQHPPHLEVVINGKTFDRTLPPGAGDDSVKGRPEKGRLANWRIPFPASLLQSGENRIEITTRSGSWLLYDAVSLQAPAETTLDPEFGLTRIGAVDSPPLWRNGDVKPYRPAKLQVVHLSNPTPATLTLDGVVIQELELQTGPQNFDVRLPAAEAATSHVLQLSAGNEILDTRVVELHPPTVRDLWILPHSHVDIGYTHHQDEVVDIQIQNLETALALAKASADQPPGMRFKWNPEAIWVLDHYLRRATDAQRSQLITSIQSGDIGVDGLYGNMLTGLCRPEELMQSLAFGARWAEVTGVPTESAAICDVPGWTWGLVSAMKAAGVKYFAIGPNYSARIGHIHRWDNQPFYWVGPSGRDRVLCWIVDNYHFLGDLEANVNGFITKLDRDEFPYDMALLFWVGQWPNGGVDNAPPDEQLVDKVVAWNAQYAAPRLRIGLVADFMRAFESRHGDSLPEHAGDLTPYWEDGAGSTSRETGLNRASAGRLAQAETLYAMLNPTARPMEAFDTAWKNVLLYSEHTWGSWCSISQPDDPFTLNQWETKKSFALQADEQSHQLLTSALSARVPTAPEAPPALLLDVFNTTQWPRTDLVAVPKGLPAQSILADDGQPAPSQRLSCGTLVFLAEDVPGFAARRYQLSDKPAPPSGRAQIKDGHLLLTSALQVRIDPNTGAISSLKRRSLGHDFVDPQAPVAINDYRYVLTANTDEAQANGPVQIQVLEDGPLVVHVRITSDAPGCNKLVRDVQLVDGLDWVECINHVDRESVREKDSVHFGFGFNVPGQTLRMETPWAVVRPNTDQLPGSCFNWYTVQRWVDVSNDNLGILWAPIDAPLMQVGAMTANLMGAVGWDEWMTEAPDSPTVYSWAQNNHWFTNYKADQPGLTTFRYRLQPHEGGYAPIPAARFGLESTRPLLATASDASMPLPNTLLTPTSPDVLVETLKVSNDNRAYIVRLYGITGKPTTTSLRWNLPKTPQLWLTDLSEIPRHPIRGRLTVPAYGVVNIRAEFKGN